MKIDRKMRGVQAPLILGSVTPSMNLKPVESDTPGNTMNVKVKTKVIASRNCQEIRKDLLVMTRKAINLDI